MGRVMRPTLSDALTFLFPNESWVLRDCTDLEWLSESDPPDMEVVQKELVRLQKEYDASEYRRLRAPEYPPVQDFADAMYWLRNGDEAPMIEYERRVAAVKDKYPKPASKKSRKRKADA